MPPRNSSSFQPICGILSAGSRGVDRHHLAVDPAEPGDGLELAAALRHQLHADADAEKRPAATHHRLVQRLFHAGHRGEAAPAIGEGADARQHDAVGVGDAFRRRW